MFTGNVAAVKILPDRQLFTDSPDSGVLNTPPSSVTSPANVPPALPLATKMLFAILFPASWKNVGTGVPLGNSNPSTPLLALPAMTLFSTRSAYVAASSTPTPHGASPVVELLGVVRLLFSTIRLLRKMVHRWIFVVANFGVGLVFSPELHAPSCGGGSSSPASEFGTRPAALCLKSDLSMIRWPPELVPE